MGKINFKFLEKRMNKEAFKYNNFLHLLHRVYTSPTKANVFDFLNDYFCEYVTVCTKYVAGKRGVISIVYTKIGNSSDYEFHIYPSIDMSFEQLAKTSPIPFIMFELNTEFGKISKNIINNELPVSIIKQYLHTMKIHYTSEHMRFNMVECGLNIREEIFRNVLRDEYEEWVTQTTNKLIKNIRLESYFLVLIYLRRYLFPKENQSKFISYMFDRHPLEFKKYEWVLSSSAGRFLHIDFKNNTYIKHFMDESSYVSIPPHIWYVLRHCGYDIGTNSANQRYMADINLMSDVSKGYIMVENVEYFTEFNNADISLIESCGEEFNVKLGMNKDEYNFYKRLNPCSIGLGNIKDQAEFDFYLIFKNDEYIKTLLTD